MARDTTREIKIVLGNNYTIDPNLHMRVSISKSRLTLPNTAKIEIFNISEKTQTKLEEEPKIKVYLDGNLLFSGKVINPQNEYLESSWLCTLYCSDIKTNPHIEPQYLQLEKGTSNDAVVNEMGKLLSDMKLDTTAFKDCLKSKGSLLKAMVVEYKKEHDILKALQNMFKGCNTEVIKEDGVVKLHSGNGVPNAKNPLLFNTFIKAPTLSFKDVILDMPLAPKIKLGLGFKIQAKSTKKQLSSPYTFSNKFVNKLFKIVEFTHTFDNYTNAIALTQVKGMNIG